MIEVEEAACFDLVYVMQLRSEEEEEAEEEGLEGVEEVMKASSEEEAVEAS